MASIGKFLAFMFAFLILASLVILPTMSVKADSTSPVESDIENASGSGSNTIFVNQPLQLIDVASGGTPPYTYQWYLNGTQVPDAMSQNFTFIEASDGLYFVACEVTDSLGNNGGGVSELPLFITVTNPSPSASPIFSLSPTPTVPEFSWWVILPFFLSMISIAIALLLKKSRNFSISRLV